MHETPARLTPRQQTQYEGRGYHFPVSVLGASEVVEFRTRFLDYISENSDRLKALPPRRQYLVLTQTHALLRWVYRIASHPNVLDAVESILGPNLLVWESGWFAKLPGETKYISWHQDSLYFGLNPPKLTTAWIALTDSTLENGCLRVIPGSQKHDFRHREGGDPDNALSRGQEVAVPVDESEAIDVILKPGEMSLHHAGIVHGSNVNRSSKPRIGLAVRYVTPDVVHTGPERQLAFLVRGQDPFGHFELLPPPNEDFVAAGNTIQRKILERMGAEV